MKRKLFNKLIFNGTVLALVTAFLVAAGFSLIRHFDHRLFPERPPDPVELQRLVKSWRAAVVGDDARRAILQAQRLTAAEQLRMPKLPCLKLFRQFGLSSVALTSPLGEIDYRRWRDAAELQQLADRIVNSADAALDELFAVVNAEIKPSTLPVPTLTLMEIWRRKSGGPEDRIRLLGGLAAYFGYRMTVVCLTDFSHRPFFALAEFRRNGQTHVADFLYGRLYRNVTVAEMTAPANWHPDLKKALTREKIYFVPVEPVDYRNAEQDLYRRLEPFRGRELPIFPTSAPSARLRDTIRATGADERQIFFWTYPLAGLAKSPLLPKNWRILPPAEEKKSPQLNGEQENR